MRISFVHRVSMAFALTRMPHATARVRLIRTQSSEPRAILENEYAPEFLQWEFAICNGKTDKTDNRYRRLSADCRRLVFLFESENVRGVGWEELALSCLPRVFSGLVLKILKQLAIDGEEMGDECQDPELESGNQENRSKDETGNAGGLQGAEKDQPS